MSNPPNTDFMKHAMQLAQKAQDAGEVPVGAVIVHEGTIIAAAQNRMRELNDPTAHAEMLALREALKKRQGKRLDDCDLYVTLEPCTMCAGAISHARVRRVYYGAGDVKAGAVDNGVRFFDQPSCHHAPEVVAGLHEEPIRQQLQDFFSAKR